MPIGWEIAIITLWIAVCCISVVIIGVLRQLQDTPAKREGATPGKQGLQWGPTPGAKIPEFTGRLGNGSTFTEHDLIGKPGVLLFMTADCNHCTRLADQIREIDLEVLPSQITLVTSPEGAKKFNMPTSIQIILEKDKSVSRALNVKAAPFAIALDRDGFVRAKQAGIKVSEIAGLSYAASLAPSLTASPARQLRLHVQSTDN